MSKSKSKEKKPKKRDKRDSAAREARQEGEKFGNGQRDRVDEASWESFPASDPPATNAGTFEGSASPKGES
jgi:hypothetical protein